MVDQNSSNDQHMDGHEDYYRFDETKEKCRKWFQNSTFFILKNVYESWRKKKEIYFFRPPRSLICKWTVVPLSKL